MKVMLTNEVYVLHCCTNLLYDEVENYSLCDAIFENIHCSLVLIKL